jgi:hypothetical protein
MSNVTGRLAGFTAGHQGLWLNQSESINDDLALDGLNGVDNHGDSTVMQLFKGLCSHDQMVVHFAMHFEKIFKRVQ